jgi:hypothetical protein
MRRLGPGGRWPSLDTIAIAQTAVVAVLLVTQFVPQPHVSSGVADQGGLAYGVPLADFVVMAVSLPAGFGMLLTGASRSGARLRYGVLAVVTLLLAIQPVTSLISANAGREYPLVLAFSAAQLAILAVWWRWSARPVLVWVLLPAYYLLVAGVWLVFAAHGRGAAGAGVVLQGLAAELLMLPLVLVFPILSFSTDWVSRVQQITGRVLLFRDPRGRLRFSRPLPYATAIVAAALLTGEILAGAGLAGGLATVLVITVIMIALIRLAGIGRHWPRKVATRWIFAGAAVFVIDFLVLVDFDPFPPGRPDLLFSTAAALAQVPLALAALLVAVVFILAGRARRPELAAGGLLLAMVALVILTATYPTALAGLGLRTPQPHDILGAVDVGAAAAALVWLGLLWCRGQWGTQDARLRQVLVLLVSLASIRGVYALLHWSAGLGPEFTLLLAGFFLLPALWVYLVPLARRRFAARRGPADRPELGELLDALDDEDSQARTGRGAQLLQTGFVLVSNSLFVYLGTFRAPVSGEVQPDFLRSDLTASAGLLLLGPPVVVLAFALRLRLQLRPPLRLWRRPPVRTELAVTELAVTGPAVTGPGVTRRARWLVVTGVAVTVFITAALFAVAFPRSVRASADQSYQATVPGVGCDDGDATWAILPPAPLGVACTPGALQITVAAGRTNAVSFVPPDGYFAGDYRLSVHVNFGGLASGCLTLETRVTTAGYYWANVCSQGTWTIDRSDGAVLTALSDGLIAPAQSHTVQVTAQGASQRLAIDGRQVAVVADPRYTRTAQLVIGVQNLTGQPGQAGLSNFTFTPAGTAAPAGAERTQLTAPAPACGAASGSWGLMTPVTTQLRCGHGPSILTVSPGALGELGFAADAAFPAAYRVAVRVNLARMPGGCAVLGLAMRDQSGYLNEVCADGIWAIDGPVDKVLGHGGLPGKAAPRGSSTEIETALSGGVDRLIVNGVPVAEVPAPAAAGTAYILLAAFNRGTGSGSASFSDFAFRPGG